MTHYRIYILDQSGKIETGSSAVLPDDQAAFEKAIALSHEGAVEVWDGTRKVCYIDRHEERCAS